jgi:hypothetical protein
VGLPETGESFFAADAVRLEDVEATLAIDEIEARLVALLRVPPLVGLTLFLTGAVPVLLGARLSDDVAVLITDGRVVVVVGPMVEVRRVAVAAVEEAELVTDFVEPVLEVAGTVGRLGGAVEAPAVEVRTVVGFVAVVDVVVVVEPTRGLGAAEVVEVGRFGATTFAAPWLLCHR